MKLILLDADNIVVNIGLPEVGVLLSDRHVFAHTTDNVVIGSWFNADLRSFQPPARKRWITKLAFDNRFSMTESMKLKTLQVFPARGAEETDEEYATRTQIPAQLQVLAGRLSMASYVDLTRPDTRAGVAALETMGLLAPGRVQEILDGPIQEAEYHHGA